MNKFKIAVSVCASLVILAAFQNCGTAQSAKVTDTTLEDGSKLVVEPVTKPISHYTIPLNFQTNARAELLADGSVVNVATGASYPIDPALQAELREALAAAEVCSYKIEEPASAEPLVRCLAMAVPHAFATAADGEEFQLSVSICGADTFDLCQSSRNEFARLVSRVRNAIQTP